MLSPFFNGSHDVVLSKFRFWTQTFLSCTVLQSDTKEINRKLSSCMKRQDIVWNINSSCIY